MGTPFTSVYNRFLGKITDDMYLELTPQDTERDLKNLLIDAVPAFEFPRKTLDYVLNEEPYFEAELDSEEINILAILMMLSWLQRQITSIENIRMKYSGMDFKFTSQANHLAKLLTLRDETRRQALHMQRLYKRRRKVDGKYESNWDIFRTTWVDSTSSTPTPSPTPGEQEFVTDASKLDVDGPILLVTDAPKQHIGEGGAN